MRIPPQPSVVPEVVPVAPPNVRSHIPGGNYEVPRSPARVFLTIEIDKNIDQIPVPELGSPLVHEPRVVLAKDLRPPHPSAGRLDLHFEGAALSSIQHQNIHLFRVAQGERSIEASEGELPEDEELARERYVVCTLPGGHRTHQL